MQFGNVGRQACDSTAKEGIRSLLGNGLSAYFFLLESVDCSSPLDVDAKPTAITSSSFEPTPGVGADGKRKWRELRYEGKEKQQQFSQQEHVGIGNASNSIKNEYEIPFATS